MLVKKILLIDSPSPFRESLIKVLKNQNYEIVIQESLRKVGEILENDSFNFDLIFLNYQVDNPESISILKLIRSCRGGRELPIILLSESAISTLIDESKRYQVAACFLKVSGTLKDIIYTVKRLFAER